MDNKFDKRSWSLQHRKEFQTYIFSWWRKNKRDLPWRHTHDPYKILVSEIMLQQTQVSRVLSKYNDFIKKFPTAKALSAASTSDVLRVWKGMGYNRRALYLKKAAEIGRFPKIEQELVKLPGVGTYTARAILVFAYRQDVAMVDTNIRRIITHFFFNDTPQKEKVIQQTADQLLPKGKSWEWHQALMDYGALEMKKIKTNFLMKTSEPFKNSNRYFRGRLVDKLREKPVEESVLLQDFSQIVIEGLIKDGLVERKGRMLRLPQ